MEEIILSGQGYFQSLLSDIFSAESTIDLETYTFKADQIGNEIANALTQAVSRGVKVRVLVDAAGTPVWGKNIKNMEKSGIEIRVFHPFPWKLWQWSRSNFSSPVFLKLFYLISRINSRNHRKTCIIDEKIIYIGSANIAQNHVHNDLGGDNWRDTTVKLMGYNITDLQYAFNIAWTGFPVEERIRKTFHRVNKNPTFRLNYSRHQRRVLYKDLLRKISRSKKRVWITNAYFNPDYFLLRKIISAKKNGIDIKIMLPEKSDVLFMPLISQWFIALLLKENVPVYEYLPSFLHAKLWIIDDWFSIGSSNLNHRSLMHDLEVDVNINTLDAKQILEKQFLEDIQQAQLIDLKNLQNQPIYKRLFARMLLIVRYFF